jgi:glutamine cyclotransferase
MMSRCRVGLAAVVVAAACGACRKQTTARGYAIIERLPHDSAAYTQGLLLHESVLYESTGTYGRSQLRRVELATGQVIAAVPLPPDRFGEGLARVGDRLYQLTWHSGVGYVYELRTLALVDSFKYQGEGWGLTSDGRSLIMSNGSATLTFLDPTTFAVIRDLTVQEDASPLSSLNELEYVDGELLANIYRSTWIVRIDPTTGQVLGWLDCADLVPEHLRGSPDEVLNGIALDSPTGHLLVTGKRWPLMYRIQLESPKAGSSQ